MITRWLAEKMGGGLKFPEIAPDAPIQVIGDIHGRRDLLEKLLLQLESGPPVVCVGDYVDRGENSAEVLQMLYQRPEITCLRGNHEDMMLGFLANPKAHGPRWLRNGGLQTLASFGIAGVTDTSGEHDLDAARSALQAAMGEQMIRWLKTLPLTHLSGNVAVVHAAADPTHPVDDQDPDHLLWGHPAFLRTTRKDGIWVVHGHTIVDQPQMDAGRIAIDTGAYATGRLTAACIGAGSVDFITT